MNEGIPRNTFYDNRDTLFYLVFLVASVKSLHNLFLFFSEIDFDVEKCFFPSYIRLSVPNLVLK